MTEFRVNQIPLDIVRRLLLFDRWTASRSWPGEYRSGSGTVNPVEATLTALARNAQLNLPLPGMFTLAPGTDPADLIGAGDDKDVLRDGADLGVVIDSGDDGLRVTLPGLLGELLQQPEYTQDVPDFERRVFFFTVNVGAQDIRLRPALREGNIRVNWTAPGPELVVTVDFETDGEEIAGTIGIDWDRVNVTVRCRPQVVAERLRWDFGLRVNLEPEVTFGLAGIAQFEVAKGIDNALRPLIARWGTLAMDVLMLLPLRPMRDDEGFFPKLAETDAITFGLWLLDQFYHSDVPVSWLNALIGSTLLPHQPMRCLAVNAGALGDVPIDFFYARFTDRYVRHLAPPKGTTADDNGPAVVFDVAPIVMNGSAGELTSADYGLWRIPSYDAANRNGEHCVVREQFQIQLAHLELAQRSYSVSAGGPWRIRGEIQVRHANLADNAWARMQSFDFVAESANFLLSGSTSSRWFEWLEVRGDVRVKGVIEDGSGQPVGWFDQHQAIGPLPSSATGQSNGGGVMTLDDFESDEPQPLGRERRARVLVRLVQQTSLRRYMLDWLGLTLDSLQLDNAAQKALMDAVYGAPVMDAATLRIRVNGDTVAMVPLGAQQLGALQAGKVVRFPVSTSRYDLYFAPGQNTLAVTLQLGVLGESGSFDTVVSASRTLDKSDPAQPNLDWQIPLGVAGRQLRITDNSGDFEARLYLQNAFFDVANVSAQHLPKPMQVGLTRIEVVEPTELWVFNWRVMRFSARIWAELDGEQVGRTTTLNLGPFTQATPAILKFEDKENVFGEDDFVRSIDVPAGAAIKVEISGREVGEGFIPVTETDLGDAVETILVPFDEDPEEGSEAHEAQSSTTDYFRFHSVTRVRSRPPAPTLLARDAETVDGEQVVTLASGGDFAYTYATVPWTTSLRLQWCEGHDETAGETWSTLQSPHITHDGDAQVMIDWPAGTRRRVRLRARNRRGSRTSQVLRLTVT